jgi:hypothetical protein
MEEQKTKRIYCNRCHLETNHILRGSYKYVSDIETETWEGWYGEENSLYTCAGCESATLMIEGDCSESDQFITLWPPRNHRDREPKRFQKLPAHLEDIYDETVKAVDSGSLLLATIGLRTLLEGVCNNKGLKKGNLKEKIDGLRKFFPSGNIVKYLHGFRFSGNEAAHQMEAMARQQANKALDLMEDVLNVLYDLDYKASLIKNAKKRVRKPKPSQPKASPVPASVP